MLVVVFGAGASFDSVPALPTRLQRDDRPPLANELFDDRPLFREAMARLDDAKFITTYLMTRPGYRSVDVEKVLDQLMGEADSYPERHKQLAAVRFYLRVALTQCAGQWLAASNGITTYKTLL